VLTATLFRAQKKWEESIKHFEKSLQEFEALGVRQWNMFPFANMVLYEYARVYIDRDQEGDREKALDLLNQALEIFQKIGAKKAVEKTMMLVEALHPPATQAHERAVSPEGLEHTEVQSNITATPRELKLGESLELEIEVRNTRKKGAILLTKITEVIPEGFAVAKKPELYRIEGNCLILRERRLGPSRTEVVKLVLTPRIQGTFHMRPNIVYLDENGKEKTCEPKPVSITVKELGIKGWLKGER
jgi:tetratricopeptide (TPR) repeat protein